MVGHAVGVPLDGTYRLRFDRALVNLTSAALKKPRPKRRFTIARGSRTESAWVARAWRGLLRAISWKRSFHDSPRGVATGGMLGARSYFLAPLEPPVHA